MNRDYLQHTEIEGHDINTDLKEARCKYVTGLILIKAKLVAAFAEHRNKYFCSIRNF
jgi:hypothetical protein